ncbi:hypothetical protein GT043_33015, partial [Streptomyces sp. SID2131]|nr:hypothetical protein [Streptomyces sp. SID2131]
PAAPAPRGRRRATRRATSPVVSTTEPAEPVTVVETAAETVVEPEPVVEPEAVAAEESAPEAAAGPAVEEAP